MTTNHSNQGLQPTSKLLVDRDVNVNINGHSHNDGKVNGHVSINGVGNGTGQGNGIGDGLGTGSSNGQGNLSSSDITALSDRLSSAVTVNGQGSGLGIAQGPGLATAPGQGLAQDFEVSTQAVSSHPQHLGLHKRGELRGCV